MMKKVLWGLLTLAGLGCRGRREPEVTLTLPKPNADGAYPFHANELYDLYRQDGKQANELLRGKTVLVTSWVVREHTRVEIDKEQAKKGELTNPDLYLHVDHRSNGFWLSSDGIICNFPNSARDSLRALLKKLGTRDEVTVRGIVDGKLGSVFLKDCTLEKSSK